MAHPLPQLGRFAVVGAIGYVVNLATFSALTVAGAGHRPAAVAAFAVSVLGNFVLNGRWTFRAHGSLPRFTAVALAGFGVSLGLLDLGVALGVPAVAAQAVAAVAAMPVTVLGHRYVSFRTGAFTFG